jgi:hypothetical protein
MYLCGEDGCHGHQSFAVTCSDLKLDFQNIARTSDPFKQGVMQERRERARWRMAYQRPSGLDRLTR